MKITTVSNENDIIKEENDSIKVIPENQSGCFQINFFLSSCERKISINSKYVKEIKSQKSEKKSENYVEKKGTFSYIGNILDHSNKLKKLSCKNGLVTFFCPKVCGQYKESYFENIMKYISEKKEDLGINQKIEKEKIKNEKNDLKNTINFVKEEITILKKIKKKLENEKNSSKEYEENISKIQKKITNLKETIKNFKEKINLLKKQKENYKQKTEKNS